MYYVVNILFCRQYWHDHGVLIHKSYLLFCYISDAQYIFYKGNT